MINILPADAYTTNVQTEALERAALMVLKNQAAPPESTLSIAIEDDDHLQSLNRDFLGIDSPTDVLSFPSGEDDPDPDTGQANLGDIIISFPRAAEQAASAGHTVEAELQLLVVHGVLHLLGHDHAEPEEKTRMWAAQNEILHELGVQLAQFPE